MNLDLRKNDLPNRKGFSLETKLNKNELKIFKNEINKQWRSKIKEIDPNLLKTTSKNSLSIEDYHLISEKIDHSKTWTKSSRILGREFAEWFLSSNLAKKLRKKYGEYYISDEDNLGWSNIYWRLVRPNKSSDIGPLHRDSWFWKLNSNFPKPEYEFYRLKVWIPIYLEIGLNGLLVEPYSQYREDIEWEGEARHGINKPVLITPLSKLKPILLNSNPGDTIVFNDNLIHGGAINNGAKCRVSVEFTMIIKK